MQWEMGVSVHPPTPIKSHHSCGSKLRSFTKGVLEKWFQLSTKSIKSFKASTYAIEFLTIFHKTPFNTLSTSSSSRRWASPSKDWERPLHNVDQSSTSSISGKIDPRSHFVRLDGNSKARSCNRETWYEMTLLQNLYTTFFPSLKHKNNGLHQWN